MPEDLIEKAIKEWERIKLLLPSRCTLIMGDDGQIRAMWVVNGKITVDKIPKNSITDYLKLQIKKPPLPPRFPNLDKLLNRIKEGRRIFDSDSGSKSVSDADGRLSEIAIPEPPEKPKAEKNAVMQMADGMIKTRKAGEKISEMSNSKLSSSQPEKVKKCQKKK